jgi:predicted ester cyclase
MDGKKMTSMNGTAKAFFDACETGKGWAGCEGYCHADASFSAQSEPIADISTLSGYCDWMQGLLTMLPDGAYELQSWGVDEERGIVNAFAVFSGTHTAEGGPVPPTGKKATADYVYSMQFRDGKISHMTKIWNAPWTLKQLGWA